MKRDLLLRTAQCFVVALVWAAAQLAAQDKPDFSGSWVLESGAPSAGDIPQGLSVGQLLVRTNVRGEPMKPFFTSITVTRLPESGTGSETYQIGVIAGSVSGRTGGPAPGPQTHYRVEWEEQALVIESGSHTGPTPESGQWTERREVWSLESDGRLRLAITTRSSVDASRTIMLVYRRQ